MGIDFNLLMFISMGTKVIKKNVLDIVVKVITFVNG